MLEAFGLSNPGCVRPNNEDYFISDTEGGIFILADGMGGANAGEFASRMSAERLYQLLQRASPESEPPSLQAAFYETNSAVRDAARSHPDLAGMGTTLLAVRALPEQVYEICSVGDSRAYFSCDGKFQRLTDDQTWVAEVGSHLGLSDEALQRHPMRHVLTMAMGSSDELRVFHRTVKLSQGAQILLCSDGLHGVLPEEVLGATLKSSKSLPDKCHYLIEAAIRAGGPDNVTVLLIHQA